MGGLKINISAACAEANVSDFLSALAKSSDSLFHFGTGLDFNHGVITATVAVVVDGTDMVFLVVNINTIPFLLLYL